MAGIVLQALRYARATWRANAGAPGPPERTQPRSHHPWATAAGTDRSPRRRPARYSMRHSLPPAGASRPIPFKLSSTASALKWFLAVAREMERGARRGRWMRQVCTDTSIHYETAVGERMARPGMRMRLVCTGTMVHEEQTVRERRVARPGWRVRRVCMGTLIH